jgi:CRISPR/Cas system CSM-associated protein Csm3 (group 7 of RAMP superfamily)
MRLSEIIDCTTEQQWKLIITLKSDLHIGSGSGGNVWVDRAVIRSSDGMPLIPGSHLKGVVRENAEKVVELCGAFSCRAPKPDKMCPRPEQAELCAICKLFGGPQLPSSVYFSDLKITNNLFAAEFISGIRNNVSLDRWRRIAKDGRLFTTEIVPAGLTFEGHIDFARRLLPVELSLLKRAIRLTERLGGRKSVGMGNVDINLEESLQ